ncbi:hypothetical protein [Streptomyces sp. NPDC003247]|uniref:hypothetical protein n=1 Tax=Streptomyces sp. NPDC003247 TaxID=3364677 RepID=UPI0036AFDEAE
MLRRDHREPLLSAVGTPGRDAPLAPRRQAERERRERERLRQEAEAEQAARKVGDWLGRRRIQDLSP